MQGSQDTLALLHMNICNKYISLSVKGVHDKIVRKVDKREKRYYSTLQMAATTNTFGELFKKFRLRSEFSTLSRFGDALAKEGFIYEDSLYSHWQKNVRIPKDRKLLLAIIKVFIKNNGLTTIKAANDLLDSAGQGYLTNEELAAFETHPCFQTECISPQRILSFLSTTIQAKRVVRTGWTMMDIKNPESVAEHSYQLCVMAMVLADQLGVDQDKLVKMAIVHDLGEIFTGDIVWVRGNIIDIERRRKKEEIEAKGIEKIFKIINKTEEYKAIFEELMERKSVEATIFWQLDKLEMAIQALDYEKRKNKNLDEFFVSVDLQLSSPFLRSIFTQILAERPKGTKK